MNELSVIRASIAVLLLVFGGCCFVDRYDLAIGVLVSGVLLLINLWGWMWSLKTLISITREGGNPLFVTLFFSMKFIVLATCLIAIMLVFEPLVLAIANSVIVFVLIFFAQFAAVRIDTESKKITEGEDDA